MTCASRRLGVVLFQLGGPERLEEIEPFLYNLFCDPDIIDFPFARIGRRPLAKLISTTRARKVQHRSAGPGPRGRAFRAGESMPAALWQCGTGTLFTSEAIQQLRAAQCDEVVLLPLYPQYSSTTTGSSLNEWHRHFHDDMPVYSVENFYRHEAYLDAVIEKVDEALARFAMPERVQIVFSAHSVPVSVIEKGDPYQRQIEDTVQLLVHRGGWSNRHRLCYQSKVGASKWLQPSLHRTLNDLAAEHAREVCVVPVAFVSDHVETLGEIDHAACEEVRRLGIAQFEMSAGLNDSPKFIQALGQIVLQAMGESVQRFIPTFQRGFPA